jgi:hypothetical protein
MHATTCDLIGRGGHIAGYDVFIADDTIFAVHEATKRQWAHCVPNYGTSIGALSRRPGFRVGWGRFPDGAEILYFYDRDDDNFGYAFNVDWEAGSEWGYAPFAAPEDDHL